MNSYLITYDLIKTGQNYEALKEAVMSMVKNGYWKCMESVFIINSDLTALEIVNILNRVIDGNDKLIVAKLTGDLAYVGFEGKCKEWFQKANLIQA